MHCRGTCHRHRATRPPGGQRYLAGQRRCQVCEIFIWWAGLWCPCCGYRLRAHPRNPGDKAKYREAVRAAAAREAAA